MIGGVWVSVFYQIPKRGLDYTTPKVAFEIALCASPPPPRRWLLNLPYVLRPHPPEGGF